MQMQFLRSVAMTLAFINAKCTNTQTANAIKSKNRSPHKWCCRWNMRRWRRHRWLLAIRFCLRNDLAHTHASHMPSAESVWTFKWRAVSIWQMFVHKFKCKHTHQSPYHSHAISFFVLSSSLLFIVVSSISQPCVPVVRMIFIFLCVSGQGREHMD